MSTVGHVTSDFARATGVTHLILSLLMPKRLSVETRWAIIHEWKRKRQSDLAIARQVKASHQQVRRVINKYKKTGDVSDLPRSGRPRKLKEGEVRKMLHRKPGSSTRRAVKELSRRGSGVCAKTVALQAKREGLRYRVRKKKPRFGEVTKKERLKFARQHQRRPERYWQSVFASDEKSITLHSEPRGEWCNEREAASPRGTEKFEEGQSMGREWVGRVVRDILYLEEDECK